MNPFIALLLSLGAGVLLGSVFFAGLRWSVRKGVETDHSRRWFFGSLAVRLTVVMAGFFFVGQANAWRWIACLFGFILVRILKAQIPALSAKGVSDESVS